MRATWTTVEIPDTDDGIEILSMCARHTNSPGSTCEARRCTTKHVTLDGWGTRARFTGSGGSTRRMLSA